MARTFIRQETQIRSSDVYDDTLGAGVGLETNALTIQGDLNALRSQIKRVTGETSWHDDLSAVNGKRRDVKALNTDLDDLEEQKVLSRLAVLTDVTVAAARNFEVLSLSAGETPADVAAALPTTDGAVVARSALSGPSFEAHELVKVSGVSAVEPKNLVLVRDSVTGQSLKSSGRDVFGLLQYENTGVDGVGFNDVVSGNRVKISFVRQTSGLDDLEACPAADIAGKTVNYSYIRRIKFDDVAEENWLSGSTFTNHTPPPSSDSSSSAAVDIPSTATVDIAAGEVVRFVHGGVDKAGAGDLSSRLEPAGFALSSAAPGGQVSIRVSGLADVPIARFSSAPVAANVGKRVWLSTTAGQVSMSHPENDGEVIQRVGILATLSGGVGNSPQVLIQIGDPVLI